MKRAVSLVLVVSLLLTLCAAAGAEGTEKKVSGDFEYVLLEDGTAEISRYSGKAQEFSVPDTLDGVKVSRIGDRAFFWCSSLTSVTIPDSVTSIGDSAFTYCSSLTSVTIPDSVTGIGDFAFSECSSLTSVTIPDSVTGIGDFAFFECSSLTSVTIPDSVTGIGTNPFASCFALTTIQVSRDHPVLATIDGVLFSRPEKRLVCCPCAFTAAEYSIPNGITGIGDYAFSDCGSLTGVTIPDSVTSIGDHAFINCISLTGLTIPDSVTGIGANPFEFCSALTAVRVSPDHPMLATIGGVLFSKPEKRLVCYPCAFTASEYSIPNGITGIGISAFSGCSSLTGVTIPDSVTSIGDLAFFNCSSLTSVTVPDSVTGIGKDAFDYCAATLTLTVGRDSYARQYCTDNGLTYTYADALDWLNN